MSSRKKQAARLKGRLQQAEQRRRKAEEDARLERYRAASRGPQWGVTQVSHALEIAGDLFYMDGGKYLEWTQEQAALAIGGYLLRHNMLTTETVPHHERFIHRITLSCFVAHPIHPSTPSRRPSEFMERLPDVTVAPQ